MAGRRLKKVLNSYCNNIKEKEIWKVGIYCRLSNDDGTKAQSDSIINQKEMISYFLKNEVDMDIIDFYIDDGYSGTTFDRPDFKRMYNDILDKKINTVIVKDLSRFGRNYIEVGKYLENIFPLYKIRFIAIGDNIDSYKNPQSINNIIVPFKNLMNDEYARDISNKVRNAYQSLARNGKFAGGTTPYGYKKSPEDKHKLIIDEEEAKIIKVIFELTLKGIGRIKINRYLNENNYLCRLEVKRRKKENIDLNDTSVEVKHRWGTSTIEKILTNETYIGSLVFGRTGNQSYKIHKTVYHPKEKWIIVPNTHEPIISKEDFEKAQAVMKDRLTSKVRKTEVDDVTIYKGKLKCMNCNKRMVKFDDKRHKHRQVYYSCNSNTIYGLDCKTHSINGKILDSLVLEAILLQVKMVVDIEKVLKKINNSNSKEKIENEYRLKKNEILTDIERCKKLKKLAYENWKFEKISKDEYLHYAKEYEENINNSNKELAIITDTYFNNISKYKKDDSWIEHFKRNKKVKNLSKEILDELIENVFVDFDGNIKVVFKYKDNYKEAIKFIKEMEEKEND